MANFVWNQNLSGNFTGSNWTTAGHPGTGDSATLGGSLAYVAIIDPAATLAYGTVLLSDPSAQLAVNNPFTAKLGQTAGTVVLAAPLTVLDAETWAGGRVVTTTGTSSLQLAANLSLAATETVEVTTAGLVNVSGAGQLINAGEIDIDPVMSGPGLNYGLLSFATGLTNSGRVNVGAGGAFGSTGGFFVNSGTINVAANALIELPTTAPNIGAGRVSVANGGIVGLVGATLATDAVLSFLSAPGNALQPGFEYVVVTSINNASRVLDFTSGSLSLARNVLANSTISQGTVIASPTLVAGGVTFSSQVLLGTLDLTTLAAFRLGTASLLGAFDVLSNANIGASTGPATVIKENGAGETIVVDGVVVTDYADILLGGQTLFSQITGLNGTASFTLGAHGTIDSAGTGVRGTIGVATVDNFGTILGEASGLSTLSVGGTLLTNEASGQIGFTNGDLGFLNGITTANAGSIRALSGAVLTVGGTQLTNTGALLADGGTVSLLTRSVTSTGSIGVLDGGSLLFNAGTLTNPTVLSFGTGGGVISIATIASFGGTIGNFLQGDTIILQGITATASALLGTSIAIQAGTTSFIIPTAGTFSNSPTITATNSGGSTFITTNAVCYARGTRILTDHGEVAVEALRQGDRVVTLHRRGTSPIRWIGHQNIDLARHAAPARVRPVRVSRDAFGPGLPHRDLILSPDHALLLDGVLVPVRYLVDDAAIRWDAGRLVEYFHIELERHDIVLAEGLPAETWLDTGNRAMFDNSQSCRTLFPDFAPDTASEAWRTRACAPIVTGGAAVDAVRRRVAVQARASAHVRPGRATEPSMTSKLRPI